MPTLFNSQSLHELNEQCKKCNGKGGYVGEGPLGNGDKKDIWIICDCKKKKPTWTTAET